MEQFSHSIQFDRRLFKADIEVNKAWAKALGRIGIYNGQELETVINALEEIDTEYHRGQLQIKTGDEDIHSANERWLTEKTGELGQRIHTGRSRNDQVVTDLRYYLRQEIDRIVDSIKALQGELIVVAENNIETVLPGYTHLRQAQPISLSHYTMAIFFQMQRDKVRLAEARKRVNVLGLGSGALAGAAFPVDRKFLAEQLGFEDISENSIDATSDRDFVFEVLSACSIIMVHLSRFCEDFIAWSSEAYGFVEIDQAFSTGSSMMPQKRNPDSLELIRGKSARVIGNQVKLLVLLKGLPHAYSRDLQEDKEPVFDTIDQTKMSLDIFKAVVQTMKINQEKMKGSLTQSLYATDLADYLVKGGIPFRNAHAIVGKIVSWIEQENKKFSELTLDEFKQYSPVFEKSVYQLFHPGYSLQLRNVRGGTGGASIRYQIKRAKKLLDK
ncbi:argininosuccinate lyase [candidate division KSB1 bacterium RBG_16_48_16]|nr:MAG: argininosuccinate lyase [candidate division KSB1 bacterium RBG_16_48_16]